MCYHFSFFELNGVKTCPFVEVGRVNAKIMGLIKFGALGFVDWRKN